MTADEINQQRIMAETSKLNQETNKLLAEQMKLQAERDKLRAEGQKFDRDKWWIPMAILAGTVGAIVLKVLERFT